MNNYLGVNPLNDGLYEEFVYLTGLHLRGLTINYRETDVLVIFKAWDNRGMPVVLFVASSYPTSAWEYLQENYAHKNKWLKFKPDKYAKLDKFGNKL